MRSAPMAVLTITLIGCSGQPVPTAPSGPAPRLPQPVSIFMMVFDNAQSPACIPGATLGSLARAWSRRLPP